jgi:hypothetical protein
MQHVHGSAVRLCAMGCGVLSPEVSAFGGITGILVAFAVSLAFSSDATTACSVAKIWREGGEKEEVREDGGRGRERGVISKLKQERCVTQERVGGLTVRMNEPSLRRW